MWFSSSVFVPALLIILVVYLNIFIKPNEMYMADEDWGESDKEENEDESTESTQQTCLLIAIDTDALMFDSGLNGRSTFKSILISCYEILDNILLRVGSGRKNNIALATVSDDKEKAVISNFNDPFPETLKTLRNLCDRSDKELKDLYLRTDPLDMSDFFIHCKKIFAQSTPETIRYMVYITNSDNPVDDEDKKFHAVNQAKTLQDFKIYIELLTFNPNFDYSLFFHEILSAALSKFNYEYFTDYLCLKEKLLSMLIYKGHKIRFYPFRNNSKKSFDVIEKAYLKSTKILNNATVTRDTSKEVKKLKRGGTRTNVYKMNYSKNKVPLRFNSTEKDLLTTVDIPSGLVLLSVSPSLMQPGMHNTDPKFIQCQGKKDVYFNLFWQYCVDKNRVLLCMRKSRNHTRPRLVELSPKVINDVRSFLILGFPYQENIDGPEECEESELSGTCGEQELQAAEEFVKALTFSYNPTMFHNLGYCKKKEYVRSQLLDEPPLDICKASEKKEVKMEDLHEAINKFKEVCLVEVIAKKRKNVSEKTQAKSRKKK